MCIPKVKTWQDVRDLVLIGLGLAMMGAGFGIMVFLQR